MEIKINRKEFCDAFVVGSQMAGKSKVLSVLDNAKVVIRGNNAYVTSNSVQCCVTKKAKLVSSDGDVEFLVNPNDLLKGLKSLRDNELTITISSVSLSIAHNRGRIEIPVMGATDFPIMDKVESSDVYTLDSARLSSWLTVAGSFASTDELRPVLCGMLLYVKGGVIGACATDTRILFADSYEADTVKDVECVIPSSAFSALKTLLRGTESVDVALNEKHISFKTDDARLICQLQVGRFPDFSRVIPQGNNISVSVGMDDLIDAINRVGLFTDKSHSLVRMDIQGMLCRLTGSDLNLGKLATDECMCQHSGDDIKIGVSAEYLLKCINSLSYGDIVMTFSESNRPILFKDSVNERMQMLMMPMSLNE